MAVFAMFAMVLVQGVTYITKVNTDGGQQDRQKHSRTQRAMLGGVRQ